jgi:hypothetical protein
VLVVIPCTQYEYVSFWMPLALFHGVNPITT